jgi:antirestriction protein ArdC
MRLYAEVTARIVAELEAGAAPWLKPWKSSKGSGVMPVNAVTGREYHGINIAILWDAADRRGYQAQRWLTFQQAKQKGASVRKGEKATGVVFTKRLTVKDKETDEEREISMLRGYHVFNVCQVEGLPEPPKAEEQPEEARLQHAEAFIKATGAKIREGRMAAFIPSLDLIEMPPFGAFKTPASYYATHLHELGHHSGHESRLNRNLANRFGSKAYAAEELIAELTSAFLCAHLGIQGDLRHAGYLQHWAELLREDNRAIFTAAAKAQQAANYLRSFSEKPGE